MLASEWQELEQLTARITALRDRYRDAQRTRQVGLMAGLQNELARARAAREQLLRHLAAALAYRA
jgi:acetylornithine/succinyldiaminopimelate/putrescine aminotransferase